MTNLRLCFICSCFFTLFAITLVTNGQAAQQQTDSTAQNKYEQQRERAVSLARSVIKRHERTKSHFESQSNRWSIKLENVGGNIKEYDLEIQELGQSLRSLKPFEQAQVLRAINYLTIDATAAVCSSAIEQHNTGKLSDEVWIETLARTSELLPARMNEFFLKELEIWEQKYPTVDRGKAPALPTDFRSYTIRLRDTRFLSLAANSMNASIASTAFWEFKDRDKNNLSLLNASADRHLSSIYPERRLHGVELFSKLNPTWKGRQANLNELTRDPDIGVSQAAIRKWLDSSSSNDHRRMLESLSADSDTKKLAALRRVDKTTISDWGSIAPITELTTSGSARVRKAALETISQISPRLQEPFISLIRVKSDPNIRQFALDRVPLWGWSENSYRQNSWGYLSHVDSSFVLLADAQRDGLAIESAMQKLTAPFGFRPQAIYDRLEAGQLSTSKKIDAIAELLTVDPSLEATETAIAFLRKTFLNSPATKRNRGDLGRVKNVRELFVLHSKRLAPIVKELSSFIERTESTRLVETLPSFGLQAKPALKLLIKILEDDSSTWRDCRPTAIVAIRGLQEHGTPALDALLKVAHGDDYSVRLMAAITYLDLGGDPEALMPKHALSFPVLVKMDPADLITLTDFKSELRTAVVSDDCPWILLKWLGPHADFLTAELKLKFKQLMPEPSSQSPGWTNELIELLPLLPSSQEAFLPVCIEYIDKEPRSLRCQMALKILAEIGDNERLAESAVKSVMTSGGKYTRSAAEACYQRLYDRDVGN